MKINQFQFGEESVGVLQLYNKTNGKEVNLQDLKRIQQIANFVGGMS